MTNFAEILPYIVLGEYIITEFAVVLSFFMLLRVLYHHHQNRIKSFEVSKSMLLYLMCEWIFSWATIFYVGYLMIWWRTGQQIYNAYILWALGGFQGSFLVIKPVTVCFLGLDRCLGIIIPIEHRAHPAKWIIIPTIIVTVIFFTIGFMFYVLPAFPPSSKTNCGAFLCLGPISAGTAYTILRYTSSSGIVIVGAVLIFSVRKRLFDRTAVSKCTRLVCKTILLSFFLDFVPHSLTFVLYTFFEINIAVYLGPYSTFFSAMECFGCSMIYYHTIKAQSMSNNVTSQQIYPNSHSSNNNHQPTKTFLH